MTRKIYTVLRLQGKKGIHYLIFYYHLSYCNVTYLYCATILTPIESYNIITPVDIIIQSRYNITLRVCSYIVNHGRLKNCFRITKQKSKNKKKPQNNLNNQANKMRNELEFTCNINLFCINLC